MNNNEKNKIYTSGKEENENENENEKRDEMLII